MSFWCSIPGLAIAGTGHTFPMTTYLPTTSGGNGGNAASNGNKASSSASNFTMALPQAGGFTTILPPGKKNKFYNFENFLNNLLGVSLIGSDEGKSPEKAGWACDNVPTNETQVREILESLQIK